MSKGTHIIIEAEEYLTIEVESRGEGVRLGWSWDDDAAANLFLSREQLTKLINALTDARRDLE